MLSKGFFVFGLLALFVCEGATAVTDQETVTIQNESGSLSLGDMIKKLKEVITSLNNLKSGIIADASKTLNSLTSSITELKTHYLDQGHSIINDDIGTVVEFIKNQTQQTTELDVDIEACVVGRDKQLHELTSGLAASLTDCVTTAVDSALTIVNNDTNVIKQIDGNINNLPVKLAKCLINLRPITCVRSLLIDARTLLKNLPGHVNAIVNEAVKLVDGLPTQLTGCVTNIASSTATETNSIIADIETCVDNKIAGIATTAASF